MLLKTIDELKRYVALDAKSIPPAIALELGVAEPLVCALLGEPLTTWLQAQVDAAGFDPAGPGLAAGLLRVVQRPLVYFAVGQGVTLHQVSIDATGVHIMTTETSKTAFQWQTNQVQQLLLRRASDGLDALVDWLEAHRDDSAELRAWAASAVGQRHRQELFTSTAAFDEYERISASRQVFQALRPVRRRLEAMELRTVLGDELLDELHEQVRTRSVSADNQLLLDSRVYPALASLTIAYAVPALSLQLTGQGIDMEVYRYDDSNAKEGDANLTGLLQQKGSEALATGERYLRQLRDYLDRTASATRFATYFHSSAYTAPNQEATPLNRPDSKVYKFC